jgi:hypothetical protein
VQYFAFHEVFSLTLNARINPHCWRFCFGIIWGWKFPKLTFVLPKLILKYNIVNSALEVKPVKGTTSTSCVEIAPFYNVLFCGFFVMFRLLRKEFTLNWTCSGGIARHKVQFWGFFGCGGVGGGRRCVPHLLLEGSLIILLFAWCILSSMFFLICPHKNMISDGPCRRAIFLLLYGYISLVLLVFLHLSRFEVWEDFRIADYQHKLSLLLLRSSHHGNEACSKFGGVCVYFGMFQFLCLQCICNRIACWQCYNSVEFRGTTGWLSITASFATSPPSTAFTFWLSQIMLHPWGVEREFELG